MTKTRKTSAKLRFQPMRSGSSVALKGGSSSCGANPLRHTFNVENEREREREREREHFAPVMDTKVCWGEEHWTSLLPPPHLQGLAHCMV